MRRELLVEELLQLQGTSPLRMAGRIQRRVRMARSSASMMRVESPMVLPFNFSTGNVAPRVIAYAHIVCIIGGGALRTCGMRL